jgi:hypothetical protein
MFHVRLKSLLATAVVLVASAATLQSARADLLVKLANDPIPSGPNFLYKYEVFLEPGFDWVSSGGNLNPNNLVTLYDVEGLVGGASLSGGWVAFATPSVNFLGSTPVTQAPPDDPLKPNITVTLNDPSPFSPISNPGPGIQLLGEFSFISTNDLDPDLFKLFYSASSQRGEDNPPAGGIANNTSRAPGPGELIPEPTSLMLLGLGLPLLGVYFWRRRTMTA